MRKQSGSVVYVRQLCSLGLGGQIIMPELLRTFHEVVPSLGNLFVWAGEAGEPANLYFENIIAEIAVLYLMEYANRAEGADFCSFFEMTDSGEERLFRTIDPKVYRSEQYEMSRRPLDDYHVIAISIREDGKPLGTLVLFRSPRQKPFSQWEESLLARLSGPIARAAKSQRDLRDEFVDSGESGMIVLNGDGKAVHMSEEGRRLLFLATHPEINRHSVTSNTEITVPVDLARLCHRVRNFFQARNVSPPVLRSENPWGKFVFRAFWLNSDDPSANALIGVTITREEPLTLKLMRNMHALGLSAQQREICLLIAYGYSHTAIAKRLHLSNHTVIDYVRKIYQRLDVHSHEVLLKKLRGETANFPKAFMLGYG
jgi:DNA-binding CsgD family transcriptional regulator